MRDKSEARILTCSGEVQCAAPEPAFPETAAVIDALLEQPVFDPAHPFSNLEV